MDEKLNVVVIGRSEDALSAVENALRPHTGLRVQRKQLVNGSVDPLEGVDGLPDALVMCLGDASEAELECLAARPADRRPPLVVIGSVGSPNLMRLAMQAGARDLLPLPLVEDDLLSALERIAKDHAVAVSFRNGSVTAFINAKGGCGATLLACNVAHILAAVSHRRVCLIDLDLQFGAIPMYFDLAPKRGVLQALENIDGLDEVALEGYLVKQASGLRILGHAADDEVSTQVVSGEQVRKLLSLVALTHDHVIVDLPRRIEPVSASVIGNSRQIVLVVQQSVTTLRDGKRLLNCLRRDFSVNPDQIVTVVNRYDKDSAITAEDIRSTLGCGELAFVPNDFPTVSECINTGTPLLDVARGAAITRAVMSLETRLGGHSANERPGFLARTLSSLTRQRSL